MIILSKYANKSDMDEVIEAIKIRDNYPLQSVSAITKRPIPINKGFHTTEPCKVYAKSNKDEYVILVDESDKQKGSKVTKEDLELDFPDFTKEDKVKK